MVRSDRMATYQTENGTEERPLIFKDSNLANEIAKLRDRIVADQGCGDEWEITGLKAGKDGSWLGVFTPKAKI